MKNYNFTRSAVAIASATLLLSACGDSSNLPATASGLVNGTDIPISATTSSTGATEFIKTIVAAGGSETAEPLLAGDVMLSVSETDEPDQTI